MPEQRPIRCILFDLDGTLADTAPDLGGALNSVRIEDGLPPLPISTLRPLVSQGVRGLLHVGYAITPDAPAYDALWTRVLQHYSNNLCVETQLFDGMAKLLETLESRHISWGIVTNKHSRYTQPLVRAMQLDTRAACVVSGDTTPKAKPAPEPLLHAARECAMAPDECLYLGDDERDIVAARAAGMRSVAVRWGYLGVDKPIDAWGADILIDHPLELLDYLPPAA